MQCTKVQVGSPLAADLGTADLTCCGSQPCLDGLTEPSGCDWKCLPIATQKASLRLLRGTPSLTENQKDFSEISERHSEACGGCAQPLST